MKITAVSDWHGHIDELKKLAPTDVLCICGDMLEPKTTAEEYLQLLESLDFDQIFLLPGNHELQLAETHHWSDKVKDLRSRSFTFGGIKFGGFNYTSAENEPELANIFLDSIADSDEVRALSAAIPSCDVLISHAPPLGILDEGLGMPYGKKLKAKGIKLVLCGHIHEHGGEVQETAQDVTVMNLCGCVVVINMTTGGYKINKLFNVR